VEEKAEKAQALIQPRQLIPQHIAVLAHGIGVFGFWG
jgi:hypothetical protein